MRRTVSQFSWLDALHLALILLIGLTVSSVVAGQGTVSIIDYYKVEDLEKLVRGQTFTFKGPDGKYYSAVFDRKVPGSGSQLDLYLIDGVVEVSPPVPDAQGVPGTPRTEGDTGTSQERAPWEGGVGAAVGGAVGAFAGHIAVPPSLRRELRERETALNDAIHAGQVQVDLYARSLSSSVAGAEQAAQTLRAAAAVTTFTLPTMPVERLVGGAFPDFSEAPWPLRRSLESSWVVLQNTFGASDAHRHVRNMGLHALGNAQQRLHAGDVESAAVAGKLAEAAAWTVLNGADLLIGLNPLAAMARDATELITGKDLLTGEALDATEMWLRAASLSAGLVTGGAANTVRQALSRVAPIIDSANGVRKLLDVTLEIGQHIRTRWSRVDEILGTMTNGTDDDVRQLAFRAIREGDAYWDAKEKNVAFFLKGGEQKWLQVILDFEKRKTVSVVPRGINFDLGQAIKTEEGLRKRFLPLEIPTKQSPSGLTLNLPGKD